MVGVSDGRTTPSSALFYGSAVMVHVGVYLVRLQPLFRAVASRDGGDGGSRVGHRALWISGRTGADRHQDAPIFSTSGQAIDVPGKTWTRLLATGVGASVLSRVFAPISSSARRRFCTNCMVPAPARCRLCLLADVGSTWRRATVLAGRPRQLERGPLRRLAGYLSVFDTAVVDRATGCRRRR